MEFKHRKFILPLILFGYFVVLVVAATIGNLVTNSITTVNSSTQNLYIHPFAISNAAADLKSAVLNARAEMLRIVFVEKNVQYTKAAMVNVQKFDEQSKADLAIIKSSFLGDMNQVVALETQVNQLADMYDQILHIAESGDFIAAQLVTINEGTPIFENIAQTVDYVLTFARYKAKSFNDEAKNTSTIALSQSRKFEIVLIVVVILTAISVVWFVADLQKEIVQAATIDALTGVSNRRAFMELTERELNRAKRYGLKVALVMVDLDLFKRINDTYGHQTGDIVLKKFCDICEKDLRGTDIFGRIGGEEFAIVLPDTPFAEAQEVIERIRQDIEKTDVQIGKDSTLHFTASFGMTELTDGTDFDGIFKHADQALYNAKESGRNKVCVSRD
jgi:diguanylate cyclase (GGDEF)-like protein